MKEFNVLYTTDHNYLKYMITSMYSLLDSNSDNMFLKIHIIKIHISFNLICINLISSLNIIRTLSFICCQISSKEFISTKHICTCWLTTYFLISYIQLIQIIKFIFNIKSIVYKIPNSTKIIFIIIYRIQMISIVKINITILNISTKIKFS